MEQNKLAELFKKYGLVSSDYFKHKHYSIITRQGIDKIQAKERIFIEYVVEKCEPEFCVVRALAQKDNAKIQTLGSAKYGAKEWNQSRNNGKGGWDEHGNATTWYIAEMAEKRAMSRAVLKLTGFYELGVFGEDESEDFKKPYQPKVIPKTQQKVDGIDPLVQKSVTSAVSKCKTIADVKAMWDNNTELHVEQFFIKAITSQKKNLIDNGIDK